MIGIARLEGRRRDTPQAEALICLIRLDANTTEGFSIEILVFGPVQEIAYNKVMGILLIHTRL